MEIFFKKSDSSLPVFIPEYKTGGAAGLDLCSASTGKIVLKQFEAKLIPTNLILEIPDGYEAQIRPRSGLALKHNVTVLNSPGTIDSDYRGEVKVLLINFGAEDFVVNLGDRIAQMVISKFERIHFNETESVSETSRGGGGYGSTGVN